MPTPPRSRHGLTPCPTCRRHVVAATRPDDTRCPFCPTPRLRGRGRVLAASLLALGLTACGGSDDGGSTAPPADETEQTTGDEAPEAPAESPPPAEDAEDGATADDGYGEAPESPVVALYGVAPE